MISIDDELKAKGISYFDFRKERVPEKHRIEFMVPYDMRRTSDHMSLSEKTEIIGIRATHIKNGGRVFIDISDISVSNKNEEVDMSVRIAEKELANKKCPLVIKRYFSKTIYEEWSANEMVIP